MVGTPSGTTLSRSVMNSCRSNRLVEKMRRSGINLRFVRKGEKIKEKALRRKVEGVLDGGLRDPEREQFPLLLPLRSGFAQLTETRVSADEDLPRNAQQKEKAKPKKR